MEYIQDTTLFMEKCRLLLSQGEEVPIMVQGNSMVPVLAHRRDIVWVKAIECPPRVGDIVLYRRENGSYILHRIYKVKNDIFTIVGDAHTVLEDGIRYDQIMGVVVRIQRKGKIQEPGDFLWEFFRKVWIRVVPIRPIVIHVYTFLTRHIRRFL